MKRIENIAASKFIVFIALLCAFSFTGQAQNKKDLSEFNITFENTDSGLNLTCTEGCAWRTLSLKTEGNTSGIKVDGYGLVTGAKESQVKLPTFGLMVKKSGNDVMLIGTNGTSWNNLKFALMPNKRVSINENGMMK